MSNEWMGCEVSIEFLRPHFNYPILGKNIIFIPLSSEDHCIQNIKSIF